MDKTAPASRPLRFRRYETADTAGLIELFRKTVHTVCRRDYSVDQLNAWAPAVIDPEKWTVRLGTSFTIVAESDGRLAGFANLKEDGCVDMLFVAVEWQSRNVATNLLVEIENEAKRRGLKRLYSDVSLTARRFFLGKGFVVEKEYSKNLGEVTFPNAIMAKQIG